LIVFNIRNEPQFYFNFGRVADQGYWLHNTKNFIQNGNFINDKFNFGLFTAPLYTIITSVSAMILGNIYLTAVIISIISIGLLIPLIYITLPKDISINKRVITCVLLAVNYLFWQYARLALPEMLSNFFLVPSLLLMLSFSSKKYLFSGFLMALAILVKSTNIQFIAVSLPFLFIEGVKKQTNYKQILYWVLGLLFPLTITVATFGYLGLFKEFAQSFQSASNLFYPSSISDGIDQLLQYPQKGFWNVAFNFFIIIIPILYGIQMILYWIFERKIRISRIDTFLYLWIIGGSLMYAISHFQPLSRPMAILVPLIIINLTHYRDLNLKTLLLLIRNRFESSNIFTKIVFITPLSFAVMKLFVLLTNKLDLGILIPKMNQVSLFVLLLLIIIKIWNIKKMMELSVLALALWIVSVLIFPILTFYILIMQWFDNKYQIITTNYFVRTPAGIIVLFLIFMCSLIMILKPRILQYMGISCIILYFIINTLLIGVESLRYRSSIYESQIKISNTISSGMTISGVGADLFMLDNLVKVIHYVPPGTLFYGNISSSIEDYEAIDWYLWDKSSTLPEFVQQKFIKIDNYDMFKESFGNNYLVNLELWKRN